MIKNIKHIENKGYLKALLKNEYPRYISKDFSKKIMLKIYAQQEPLIKTYTLRIASAFIFGIITLFVMNNMLSEDIKYTKTTIDSDSMTPSRNVSTQIDECKNIDDKPARSDIIECK